MSLVPPAKITVPQLPPGFVARAGLWADLDAAGGADVALVCAPAGYGKTLLLADWARASTEPTGPTSTRPGWAWTATTTTRSGCGRRWWPRSPACPSVPAVSRLHGPWAWRPGAQPEFLAELADAVQALPRPVRLILDDVHELVDPVALHGLQILMRNRPAALQLVLSSRFDPPLSLPRLRLAGRLWELRAARLRFSPAEAAHPARAVRAAPHPAAGRGAAPAHRRLGRRSAAGRARAVPSPPTARRSSTSSPATTARWPTTWSGRSSPGCRRTSRSSCA